jgi:hypothetical protein
MTLKGPVGSGLPVTYIAVKPYFAPAAASRAFAQRRRAGNTVRSKPVTTRW